MRQRKRRVVPTHAIHRCLEPEKALLLHCSRHFSAKAPRDRGLVADNAPPRLVDTRKHCLAVPRQDGAQVDDLARHIQLLLCHVRGALEHAQSALILLQEELFTGAGMGGVGPGGSAVGGGAGRRQPGSTTCSRRIRRKFEVPEDTGLFATCRIDRPPCSGRLALALASRSDYQTTVRVCPSHCFPRRA